MLVRLYVSCKYDVRSLLKSGYYVMGLKEDKNFRFNWLNGEHAKALEIELGMAIKGFKDMCNMVGADPNKVLAVVRQIRKRELYSETYDEFAFRIENVASQMRDFFAAETEI